MRVVVAAGVLVATLSLHGATPALERFEFAEPHMGTLVRLVLYAPDRSAADAASTAAFARIGALNDALSD